MDNLPTTGAVKIDIYIAVFKYPLPTTLSKLDRKEKNCQSDE